MKNKLWLLIILIFSFALYTYRLNSTPALYVDEAVVGYDAYSLLKTGQDHFGQPLPIYFRFFASYTPGLYVYLIVPLVKFLGLNLLSVRLLSAVCGTVSVYFFYLFSGSLIGTLFYTILPWTLFNSRLGYEVMLAATLFNAGVYFLHRHFPKPSLLGLLLISLSTYAAHTQRYLAPLFLLGYFIFFVRPRKKDLLWLTLSQTPNLIMLFTSSFWVKSSGASLHFFLTQLTTFFSPKTLFFELPDIDLQHQLPSLSVFFWWMIVPLFFGLKKSSRFLRYWILISIIPACLTGEFISIQRALPLAFPLMLVISQGLTPWYLLLFPYSLLLLYRAYFLFLPAENYFGWNYGYAEVSRFIAAHPSQRFLVDNTRNPRNYILPLFYLHPDPPVHLSLPASYYSAPPVPSTYAYQYLTFKSFSWTDLATADYVVADPLTFTPAEATTHHLTLTQTISQGDHPLFQIYRVK